MAAPTSQSPTPCLVDPFPSVSTHYPDLPGGPRRLPTAAPQTPSSDPDLPSPTGSGAQPPPTPCQPVGDQRGRVPQHTRDSRRNGVVRASPRGEQVRSRVPPRDRQGQGRQNSTNTTHSCLEVCDGRTKRARSVLPRARAERMSGPLLRPIPPKAPEKRRDLMCPCG